MSTRRQSSAELERLWGELRGEGNVYGNKSGLIHSVQEAVLLEYFCRSFDIKAAGAARVTACYSIIHGKYYPSGGYLSYS